MMTMAAINLQADCISVLHQCDDAVQALQKENALQAQIIKDQNSRYDEQTKEIKDESLWKPIALGATAAALLEGAILVLKH